MFGNCECECDLICAAKMSNLSLSDVFFHGPNAPKLVTTLPRLPRRQRGHPLPIPFPQSTPKSRRLRRLDLDAALTRRLSCQLRPNI